MTSQACDTIKWEPDRAGYLFCCFMFFSVFVTSTDVSGHAAKAKVYL